jgi:hypothetical protein
MTTSDPAGLRIHPMTNRKPQHKKDDPGFVALVEDIRANGIRQPLVVVKPDLIVDGRERWQAAKRLQLTEVPVIYCKEDEVAGVIVSGLLRKHYSKGALAYVLCPVLEDAFKEAQKRRLECLKNANNYRSGLSPLPHKTVEDLAEQIGVDRKLLFDARKLHKEFEDETEYEFEDEPQPLTLKEYFEPRLLAFGENRPLGLGAIIAGIAGLRATGGKHRPEPHQLELFKSGFDTLRTRFSYWQKFGAEQKAECREVIRETVAVMPADLRDELAAALRDAKKGQVGK